MSDLDDYYDLTGADHDAYECQRCGTVLQTDFDRHDCPACDSRDGSWHSKEYSREFLPVDHGSGFTGYEQRTVRL